MIQNCRRAKSLALFQHNAYVKQDQLRNVTSRLDISAPLAWFQFKHTQENTSLENYHLNQRTTKPTIWSVWPAKTQISLYIHPVWQGFSFIPFWNNLESVEGTYNQRRLIRLSGCAWSHMSYYRFCRALAHFIFMMCKSINMKWAWLGFMTWSMQPRDFKVSD